MTIEHTSSASTSAHRTAARTAGTAQADAHGARQTGGSSGAASSFAALLGSLGADDTAGAPGALGLLEVGDAEGQGGSVAAPGGKRRSVVAALSDPGDSLGAGETAARAALAAGGLAVPAAGDAPTALAEAGLGSIAGAGGFALPGTQGSDSPKPGELARYSTRPYAIPAAGALAAGNGDSAASAVSTKVPTVDAAPELTALPAAPQPVAKLAAGGATPAPALVPIAAAATAGVAPAPDVAPRAVSPGLLTLAPDTAPGASGIEAGSVAGYRSILAQMQHALARSKASEAAGSSMSSSTLADATAACPAATALLQTGAAATVGWGNVRVGVTGTGAGSAADPSNEAALLLLAPGGERKQEGGAGASGSRENSGDASSGAFPVSPAVGFGVALAHGNAGPAAVFAADGSPVADTSPRTAEEQVADRVQHWLHQKNQTAELTLDAFGGAPVDVRISLSGNEAQVAFRSDQADTRQMLGAALADLRDMLQREGLVLTGATVNGSNAQGATGSGGGDRPPRERIVGGVTGSGADTGVLPAPAPRRPPSDGAGRALDLFV